MMLYSRKPFVLLDKQFVSASTVVLRFSRNEIPFRAGSFLQVGAFGQKQRRKYSIYSAEKDDFFEILVKVVENGVVSNQLKNVKVGHLLNVLGMGGNFGPRKKEILTKKYLFIATGTGISPFRSIISSNPGIQYTLLHGIRSRDEAYGLAYIPKEQYITCISREDGGAFRGRVTAYLKEMEIPLETECYLCGNQEMIQEAIEILKSKGMPAYQIFTEVYF